MDPQIDKCCLLCRIKGTNKVIAAEVINPLLQVEYKQYQIETRNPTWIQTGEREIKLTAILGKELTVQNNVNIEDITEDDVNRILDDV